MNYLRIFLKKYKIILIIILILLFISTTVFAYIKILNKTKNVGSNVNNIEEVKTEKFCEENSVLEAFIENDNIENNIIKTGIINNISNNIIENTTKPISNKNDYYIKVNYGANVVNIYGKDSNNEYTVPIKAMICSSGKATPKSGIYKMDYKYRWLRLVGNVYGQYCSRIVGNILFHSVPYLNKSEDSLEYLEYDKLGQTASAGCIRLVVSDAIWIYNNCKSGTKVEFYSSSDPGPLGKPSAQKISDKSEVLRNWDPTDQSSNNPWKTNGQTVI